MVNGIWKREILKLVANCKNLENMVNVRDGIVFAIAPGFEVNEKDTKIL